MGMEIGCYPPPFSHILEGEGRLVNSAIACVQKWHDSLLRKAHQYKSACPSMEFIVQHSSFSNMKCIISKGYVLFSSPLLVL